MLKKLPFMIIGKFLIKGHIYINDRPCMEVHLGRIEFGEAIIISIISSQLERLL